MVKWVTIDKYSELSGCTKEAIRNRIKKRVWYHELQYKKAKGRIYINIEEVEKWIENTPA